MKNSASKIIVFSLTILSLGLGLSSCDDDSTGPDENESNLKVRTAKDIAANPQDGSGGPPAAPTNFTYYNLENGEEVAKSDSATTKWDIAFSGLTILTNNGISGPGEAGALIVDQDFKSTSMAPSSGYTVDSKDSRAVDDWYDYDMKSHVVRPLTGKTIVMQTADGDHYVKLNILSYYKGNPDMTSNEFQNNPPPSRYYTFKYAIQMNGTKNLK